MLLKTQFTRSPADIDSLKDELESIELECMGSGDVGSGVRKFTKAATIQFGLSLFLSSVDEPNVARRVKL